MPFKAEKWAHKYGTPKNLPMHKKDKGFYSHMTHASLQKNEDSVEIIGDGYGDSFMPKTPKTAKI